MKKITKILSTSLFGISAFATTAVVATSCGGESPEPGAAVITLKSGESSTRTGTKSEVNGWTPLEVTGLAEQYIVLLVPIEADKVRWEERKWNTGLTINTTNFSFTAGVVEFLTKDTETLDFNVEITQNGVTTKSPLLTMGIYSA